MKINNTRNFDANEGILFFSTAEFTGQVIQVNLLLK